MPYIEEFRRKQLRYDWPRSGGELNFAITREILRYVDKRGLSYATCNDVVGALENAKHEFQRRLQDPYEDQKIEANGDVGYEDLHLGEHV